MKKVKACYLSISFFLVWEQLERVPNIFGVTFCEFQRSTANPKGRQPSLRGAALTYFGHMMFFISVEMQRLLLRVFLLTSIYACTVLCCNPLTPPAGISGAALLVVGFAHLMFFLCGMWPAADTVLSHKQSKCQLRAVCFLQWLDCGEWNTVTAHQHHQPFSSDHICRLYDDIRQRHTLANTRYNRVMINVCVRRTLKSCQFVLFTITGKKSRSA